MRPRTPPRPARQHRRHGNSDEDESWVPPVLQVVATEGLGIAELGEAIDAFVAWAERSGRRRQRSRERAHAQVVRALSALLLAPYLRDPTSQALPPDVARWVERVAEGAASPIEAARALVGE